jgi:hypothetical protein
MKLLLFFVICVSSIFLNAQTFTADRDKFVKELTRSFGIGEANVIRDFLPKFEKFVKTVIPQDHFQRMVQTSNKIVDRKLRSYPDLFYYLNAVYLISEKKVEHQNYMVWHELLDDYLEKNNTNYAKEYLESMANFFERGALYTATNFEWVTYGGRFVFKRGNNGLEIHLTDVNLKCRTQLRGERAVDSMVLVATSGIYDLDKIKWKGRGGRVTWEKVGLNKNETFAELRGYEIAMRTTQYRCDTVLLKTPYFKEPIMGNLVDRTWNISRDVDRKFPQFNSFNRKLFIPAIVENIDYTGGFMLQGANFVGVGTNTEKARIEYKKDNQLVYRLLTSEVNIDDQQVTINNGQLYFKLGEKDSLTHELVRYIYRRQQGLTEFIRDRVGLAVAPFVSSYHQLDIYVDRILWTKESNELIFKWHEGSSEEQRFAKFESRNYFNGQLYDMLGGNVSLHPLVSLHRYVEKNGEYNLTEGQTATALGGLVEQVKSLMLDLAGGGFIAYDLEQKTVRVLPKTEQFVKAKANKIDYDNIIFESDLRPMKLDQYSAEEIQADARLKRLQEKYEKDNKANRNIKEFGKLNLNTLDLTINACRYVPISDVRNTQVFPKDRMVIVQKNRNFIFSGWVNVGKMELLVNSAIFDYGQFEIQVGYSDRAFLSITPLKPEDGKKSITSQSYISGIKGDIKIDHPTNRSGAKAKTYGSYPKLITKTSTRVYYNDKTIQKGAYDSTRFYFEIDPFELDSLVNFNEKAMRLSGVMITGGIFPIFKQDLKIMPDYSFGFSMDAPKEGFAFYGSESKYKNKILLSNNGLQGTGTIEYVTTVAESIGLLTFMPDSTIGIAKFVTHPREVGVQMPDVSADEAFITYVPKNDVLKARSTRKPMNFFQEEAKFVGTVFVKSDGFRGSGKFNMPTAQLASNNYTATRWQILADTSNFNLRNTTNEADESTIAFASENVKCKVDFSTRKGEFISNKGSSLIQFPVNQYVCRMDKFNWVMDVDELELEKNPEATADITIDTELGLSNSNFFSTHPKQDSLDFLSLKARFDFKQKTIYCYNVDYIDVADARIYPVDKEVVIRKKAVMDPLDDATIVANYITKYHTFKKVSVNIYGKRSYVGSGEYEYVDVEGNSTNFYMKNITLDKTYQTIAEGQIPKSANFKLSPHFDFYGKFSIRAAYQTINFEGVTRVIHNCEAFSRNWMNFSGNIDPKKVMIPIEAKMKSEEGNLITSGIAWNVNTDKGNSRLYPVFLSELISNDDQNLITPTGFLVFNEEAKEYRISSAEKLENRNTPGTYLALHTPSCSLNGDGIINLGISTPGVDISTIGTISYDPNSRQTSMNVSMKFNMLFEKSVLEKVAEKMAGMPNLPSISLDNIKQNTTLEQALTTWSDTKAADKLLSDYGLRKSLRKMPAEYEATMLLTGIRLYSIDSIPQFSGLSSASKDACVVSFYREAVMKMVPLELAFYKNEKGVDHFGIYITIPAFQNYFFHYQLNKRDGKLLFVTSDQDARDKINALKADKRKSKNFEYEVSTNAALYQTFRQLLNKKL